MKPGSRFDTRTPWARLFLWVLLTCSGWAISQWVPPMQSPDENQHIARAYVLGEGHWNLDAPEGKMSGGWVDAGLEEYIRQYMRLAGKPEFRISKEEIGHIEQIRWQDSKSRKFFEMPGTGYYLPLVYFPHALGLKWGQAMDLSIHASYQLTRFVVLGFSVALIIWAFSMLAQGTGVLGILMLPMTVFQLVLPTLDGFTTALAMVIVALFARLSQPEDGLDRSWRLQGSMALCLLLVVTSRIHLLPMALLPLALGWYRQKPVYAAWGLVVLVCAFAWLLFAVTHTVDTRIPRNHTTEEILLHYATAPWDFLLVFTKTWMNADLRDFYWRSFIGILGWLDAPLRSIFYPWIGGGLLFCMLGCVSLPRRGADHLFRATLLFAAAASILLIFFALLITWTPHPTEIIAGVQGRYFVVPALLLGYALHGFPVQEKTLPVPHPTVIKRRGGAVSALVPMLLILAFSMLCLVALVSGLIARYGS